MSKPTKKTVTHYVYRDIIKYIEDKYDIKTRNYYNSHTLYADFWHWMIDLNDHVSNGSYINFPEDWRGLKVDEYPKCHRTDCNSIPQFAAEIMTMIEEEFGTDIYRENIWVDW